MISSLFSFTATILVLSVSIVFLDLCFASAAFFFISLCCTVRDESSSISSSGLISSNNLVSSDFSRGPSLEIKLCNVKSIISSASSLAALSTISALVMSVSEFLVALSGSVFWAFIFASAAFFLIFFCLGVRVSFSFSWVDSVCCKLLSSSMLPSIFLSSNLLIDSDFWRDSSLESVFCMVISFTSVVFAFSIIFSSVLSLSIVLESASPTLALWDLCLASAAFCRISFCLTVKFKSSFSNSVSTREAVLANSLLSSPSLLSWDIVSFASYLSWGSGSLTAPDLLSEGKSSSVFLSAPEMRSIGLADISFFSIVSDVPVLCDAGFPAPDFDTFSPDWFLAWAAFSLITCCFWVKLSVVSVFSILTSTVFVFRTASWWTKVSSDIVLVFAISNLSSSSSKTSSQVSASYSLTLTGSSFQSAIETSSMSASVFKSSTFSIAFLMDSYSSKSCWSTSMMTASMVMFERLAVSFMKRSGGSSTYLLSDMDSASSSANISQMFFASFSVRSGVWYMDKENSWFPK